MPGGRLADAHRRGLQREREREDEERRLRDEEAAAQRQQTVADREERQLRLAEERERRLADEESRQNTASEEERGYKKAAAARAAQADRDKVSAMAPDIERGAGVLAKRRGFSPGALAQTGQAVLADPHMAAAYGAQDRADQASALAQENTRSLMAQRAAKAAQARWRTQQAIEAAKVKAGIRPPGEYTPDQATLARFNTRALEIFDRFRGEIDPDTGLWVSPRGGFVPGATTVDQDMETARKEAADGFVVAHGKTLADMAPGLIPPAATTGAPQPVLMQQDGDVSRFRASAPGALERMAGRLPEAPAPAMPPPAMPPVAPMPPAPMPAPVSQAPDLQADVQRFMAEPNAAIQQAALARIQQRAAAGDPRAQAFLAALQGR